MAGVNVELTQYAPADLPGELNRIAAAGFVWVRQTFLWAEIEAQQGQYDFNRYDGIVQAVAAQGSLRLVAVLDSAPTWARRTEASADDRLFAPPRSMEAFARFAAEFARRYGDRIDYYQIWDEPNLNTHWGGLDPRPADYAAMLKAAYPAIKGADAGATVITAGLAPTVESGPRNLSDVLFLRALYEAGAGDSFDAVAGKPYGFNAAPDDRTVDESVLNFSRLILLREEMVRRGDGEKALWGSHFGWNHLPDGSWRGPPSIWGQVNAAYQKAWTRQAYERAAREWPWAGGLIIQAWQPDAPADDPIQGFAVRDQAAAWFESGAFFDRLERAALTVGLHHPTDSRIKYEGEWRFGPLGADVQWTEPGDPPPDGSKHHLSFPFSGQTVGFRVRRDNYVAFVYVRIDGQPANGLPRVSGTGNTSDGEAYIILKSLNLDPRTETIRAAGGLGADTHNAEARFYLGYERWPLAGIAVGDPPDTSAYDRLLAGGLIAALIGLIGAVLVGRRLPIRRAARAVGDYTRGMSGVLAGLVISATGALSLLLTINQILPTVLRRDDATAALTIAAAGALTLSPSLLVTVVALIVLWLLIYNRPLIGLALTIFWAPFFLLPVELYIWALPMVEICLLMTASALLARRLLRADPIVYTGTYRLQLADWSVLALVIVAVFSITWAEQINPATRELRIVVLEPALFYLLLRVARPARPDLIRLVEVFLWSGVVVSVVGLVQYFGGVAGITVAEQGARRLMSVYSSPNNLALFLGRCVPFAVALSLIARGNARRALSGLAVLIMGAALLLTQSIGAVVLGLPAALAVIVLLWDRRRGAILVGVMLVGLLALLPLSRFVPRLQGVFDFSRSSSFVRTQLWTSTLNLLRERPLTGAGLDQFLYLYRSRYILPEAYEEPNLSHPHNIVLDFWTRLGILGLPILAGLQFAFWRGGWRAWRALRGSDRLLAALAAGAMGSMADVLAHGMVDNSFFVVDLAYVFCFTLALVGRLSTSYAVWTEGD